MDIKKQKIKLMLTMSLISLITVICIPQASFATWFGIEVTRWGWVKKIPEAFGWIQDAGSIFSDMLPFLKSDFVMLCILFIFGLIVVALAVEFIINFLRR
jgi:hypothetical protein